MFTQKSREISISHWAYTYGVEKYVALPDLNVWNEERQKALTSKQKKVIEWAY